MSKISKKNQLILDRAEGLRELIQHNTDVMKLYEEIDAIDKATDKFELDKATSKIGLKLKLLDKILPAARETAADKATYNQINIKAMSNEEIEKLIDKGGKK